MKSIFASSTFWFNLMVSVLGAIGLITGSIDQTIAGGMITLGLANIGLRLKTSKPVQF